MRKTEIKTDNLKIHLLAKPCPPFRRKGGGVHCGSLCGARFFCNLSTFSRLRINLSEQSTLISSGHGVRERGSSDLFV